MFKKKDIESCLCEFHKTEKLVDLIGRNVWRVDLINHPFNIYKYRVDNISIHVHEGNKVGIYLNLYPLDFCGLRTATDVYDMEISSIGDELFFTLDDARRRKGRRHYQMQQSLF